MRRLLEELYRTAVEAAMPGPALAARLKHVALPPDDSPWIIALGKAAGAMASAAVEELHRRRLKPAGGLIVAPAAITAAGGLSTVVGDHPVPGPNSWAAARALEELTRRVGSRDQVWVLLSGGATSLVAAPVDGLVPDELVEIYRLLLGSGLDIRAMNLVRKRFSRWGAGRLAAALVPARVHGFIVSDVVGDDFAAIASGPCSPDPTTATDMRQLLARAGLWDRLPASARRLVSATERREVPETPKLGDRAFARVVLQLIVSNRLAVEAAAQGAAELGLAPVVMETPLAGEAAAVGASLAAALLRHCPQTGFPQPAGQPRGCVIWGGETTVILGEAPRGLGGRCQELALAAARLLAGAPTPCALLAAGTDGRDGPTDAAGAVVDGTTWPAIVAAGQDPMAALAGHDAYRALDAAGALLRPGLTGTNVMDEVIGLY